MVRHYYLRSGDDLGEIRINLLPKDRREKQSHEIALRIRPEIEKMGKKYGVNLKIVEFCRGRRCFPIWSLKSMARLKPVLITYSGSQTGPGRYGKNRRRGGC